jgi:hypothetical protein
LPTLQLESDVQHLVSTQGGLPAVVTVLTPAYTFPGGNMFIDLLPVVVAAVVAPTSGTFQEQFER